MNYKYIIAAVVLIIIIFLSIFLGLHYAPKIKLSASHSAEAAGGATIAAIICAAAGYHHYRSRKAIKLSKLNKSGKNNSK